MKLESGKLGSRVTEVWGYRGLGSLRFWSHWNCGITGVVGSLGYGVEVVIEVMRSIGLCGH